MESRGRGSSDGYMVEDEEVKERLGIQAGRGTCTLDV